MNDTKSSQSWEQNTLEKIALSAIHEQRAARRWKIFFRMIWLIIIFLVFATYFGWLSLYKNKTEPKITTDNHTAKISLFGAIISHSARGDMLVSADQVIESLESAFKDEHVKGIILHADSPGGSPVAAARIYDRIRYLRQKYPQKPIYTVVEDFCASACYYIASATDKIFVNRASLVGSIGVIINGFGFTETIKKLGIERRLIAAGENKGFLDPFSPIDPKQLAFTKNLLKTLHQQFIEAVRLGRGKRLHETVDTFSGLVWDGNTAINIGLVDGLGSVDYVAEKLIKAPAVVDFTQKSNWLDTVFEPFSAKKNVDFQALFANKLQ